MKQIKYNKCFIAVENPIPRLSSLQTTYYLQTPSNNGIKPRTITPKKIDPKINVNNIVGSISGGVTGTLLPLVQSIEESNMPSINQYELDKLVLGDSSQSAFSQAIDALTGENTKRAVNAIQGNRFTSQAQTTDDLLNEWNQHSFLRKYDEPRDSGWGSVLGTLTGTPWLQYNLDDPSKGIANIDTYNIKAGLEGVQAGSGLGVWGVVGGAVLGDWASKAKAFTQKKHINKVNSAIDNKNRSDLAEFIQQSTDIDRNQLLQARANMITDNALSATAANGGPIYIKPSKRGTFTAAAKQRGMGVQEFANKVLANKDNYSSAMVKKANFARNAAKWHALGGPLFEDFTNGVTWVNNGDTHEANPNDGVQMGIAPDGKPNLVEEGEVIFNNYVYSNRLKVPKELKEKYNLGNNIETFADTFKYLQKESEERPNDPISKNGLNDMAVTLAQSQEEIRSKKNSKQYACGGKLHKYAKGGITDYISGILPLASLAANTFDSYKPKQIRVGITPTIQTHTISDYITPEQFDRNWWTNQLLASQAGARRALMNTSSPAARAAILASDYGAGNQFGQLARQGQEYNRADKLKVFELNRATNIFNAQQKQQAAASNAQLQEAYDRLRLSADQYNAQVLQAHKQAKDAAISSNLAELAKFTGDKSKQDKTINLFTALADRGLFAGLTGKDVLNLYSSLANGGKLKTKKK